MSITEQGAVFLFSCAVGGFLGAFYDVFRIIRVAFNSKWTAVFFQDLLFCVLSAFCIILLVFHTNSGTVRWFSLLGCFLCFVLYHMTVGKLVMLAAKKIIAFIKKALRILYNITLNPLKTALLFILRRLKKSAAFIALNLAKSKRRLYYENEKRIISQKAARGFGLFEPDKKINKINKKFNKKTAKTIGRIIEKDSGKHQKSLEKSKRKI